MRKKLFAILAVSAIAASSLFASGKNTDSRGKDMGLGLNVGYPGVGLAFRYHNNDFRVLGAVAYEYAGAISIDATGEYLFARIEDENKRPIIDFSAGAGLGVGIPVGGEQFYLAFELGAIANYDFANVPLSLFIRALWRPYITFGENGKFDPLGIAASAGFTYNFTL